MPAARSCRARLGCVALLLVVRDAATAAYTPPFHIGLSAAAELLEVKFPSSKSTVRAAYRKKAASAHPDVSQAADAASQFLRITVAYETLLQYSYLVPISPPPPPPASTPAEATAPPRAGGPFAGTAPRDRSAEAPRERSDGFARRVAAWRKFWVASLQAEALAAEATKLAMQQRVLESEVSRLREMLATLLQDAGPASSPRCAPVTMSEARSRQIDDCRSRYAHASTKLADVTCAVRTHEARVRMMRDEATALENEAKGVVPREPGPEGSDFSI